MATTTNFGWTTPDDTDLVKDGASAIRTLGSAIDTSLVDLKGGTTGQVLAKASDTDMDFTWATDASGIPATIFDAKGDLIAASAADTAARLAVGTNGQFLSANSSTATGLEWVAAPVAGANWTLLNSGGTALTGAQTITVSGISGADKVFILVETASSASALSFMRFQINTATSNYVNQGVVFAAGSTYSNGYISGVSSTNGIPFARLTDSSGSGIVIGNCLITGGNSSGVKVFQAMGTGQSFSGSSDHRAYVTGGYYNSASTISSVSVFSDTGNFDAGTVYVYTSA